MAQGGIGGDLSVKSRVSGPSTSQALAPGPIIPQLPLTNVDVTPPDTSKYASVTVSSLLDLQAKVTLGACDTIINVPQSVVYNTHQLPGGVGLVLSSNPCTAGHFPIIQTQGIDLVRGVMIDPSVLVGIMAKLTTAGTTERIISCAANVPCGGWIVRYLEADYTGDTSAIILNGPTDIEAHLPHDLIWDHDYIHGHAANKTTHCFFVNGNNFGLVDSWISECHDAGNDSQALNIYAGGPMLVQDTMLEGAGENFLAMGGTNGAVNFVVGIMPHDVTHRRVWYYKPLQWFNGAIPGPVFEGITWDVKNLWESKACVRCLVEDSVMENNWIANQVGKAILNNQAPSTNGPYSYTSDSTFRYIHIYGGAAFTFANAKDGTGAPSPNDPSFTARMNRVMWSNILVENLRANWCAGAGCPAPQNYMGIGNGIFGVIVSHVTVTSAPVQFNSLEDEGNGYQRAVTWVTDNILPQGINGGYKTSGFASNSVAQLNKVWGIMQDPMVQRNVFPGMPAADVNAWNSTVTNGVRNFSGTSGPASQLAVGYQRWVDGPGGDYRLVPGSQFSATGTNPCKVNPDGSGGNADCGADVAAIMQRTAGVQATLAAWPDWRSGGGIVLSTPSMICDGVNSVTLSPVQGTNGGKQLVQNGLDILFNGQIIAPTASSEGTVTIVLPAFHGTAPVTASNFGLPLTASVQCA